MQRGIIVSFFLLAIVGVAYSRQFIVNNNCGYTVWMGTNPSMGLIVFDVDPGTVLITNADDGWRGRIWFRTNCTSDINRNNFRCVTGDCHSGVESCDGKAADVPVTLFDFLNFSGNESLYFYDVNLMHGFNVPGSIYPLIPDGSGSQSSCAAVTCRNDVISVCPEGLKVRDGGGRVVGCRSACDATQKPEDCCVGNFGSPQACHPSDAAKLFSGACPDAHTWTFDGRVQSCGGSDFRITLCG